MIEDITDTIITTSIIITFETSCFFISLFYFFFFFSLQGFFSLWSQESRIKQIG